MSGGWSSTQSRIKHLGKKSLMVEQSRQISVVRYTEVDGEQVILWPEHVAKNILLVPEILTEAEWQTRYHNGLLS